jgi:hypothetical protein
VGSHICLHNIKIQKDEFRSLERYLELGTLNEWLLLQILKQAGVQSARINSITGRLFIN